MYVNSTIVGVRTHDLEHLGKTEKPWFRCRACGRDDYEGGWGDLSDPCPKESKERADKRMAGVLEIDP